VDIGAWLGGLGMERYAQAFRENDVGPAVLAELTDDDLRGLGVSLGHRRVLLKAIRELAAPRPAAQASPPATDAPAGGSERRRLTVLFVDLVGSTALAAKLDPEEMGATLCGWQDAASGPVARFGGYVAKFMGDGMLAYFGWPRAHEDDAERAVRAGLAIALATAALRAPSGEALAARVGIATGLVVVGELIGGGAAQEQVVVGETPSLAARLQAEAAPGQVVIAEATRRLTTGSFDLASLGARALKGLAEPAEAYVVLAERRATNRFEARVEGAQHPLYGRDQELALLLERWRQAKAGEGQGVLLVGEAGIGKSRILRALLDALKDEPHTRLQYQCSPYHADSAFWPVTQQLAHAAGFDASAAPERRLDKLEALLVQAGKEAAADAPLVAALMRLDGTARYGALTLSPGALRTRTLEALTRQVLGLAARNPVVVVLEDAHWIDPTTLELFECVLDAVAEVRVLIVLTSRPDNQPALAAHPHVTRLALNRLGREGVEAIVARLGGTKLPDATIAAIVARTDGVPLFVEELTKAVVESGETSVPVTLHDTLMARLDRTADVKEIAQTAACIGREFDFALLAAIAGRSEAELVAGLERLGAAELVFRRGFGAGARYVFKHALVRDAAYESLLKTRRQAIHAWLVAALEAAGAATPPETLAHHTERAGMTHRAVEESRSLFHVDFGQWRASYVQGILGDALARGQRALAACDPADVRTLAHRMVGASLMMGRFAEGVEHLQESLAGHDPKRHADHAQRYGADTRAGSLIYLARARWCLGAVDAALTDMDASLAISRRADSALARCHGLGHFCTLLSLIDPAGAGDLVEELLASSLEDGGQMWVAYARALRAGLRMTQGDHLGALDDVAFGRDWLDYVGTRAFQPLILGFAAQAQIALGRFADASTSLRDADAMIEAGSRWTESDTRRIEGDLMLARDDAAAVDSQNRFRVPQNRFRVPNSEPGTTFSFSRSLAGSALIRSESAFEPADEMRDDQDQREVFDHQHRVDLQRPEHRHVEFAGLAREIAESDHRRQGRHLDDVNELVTEGRQDAADRLRQDHQPHLLPGSEADRARGFTLAALDRLDPAAEDLGLEGAVAEPDRQHACGEHGDLESRQRRHAVEHPEQHHQDRDRAKHFDIDPVESTKWTPAREPACETGRNEGMRARFVEFGNQAPERRPSGQPHQRDQQSERQRQHEREQRQQDGRAEAFDQEAQIDAALRRERRDDVPAPVEPRVRAARQRGDGDQCDRRATQRGCHSGRYAVHSTSTVMSGWKNALM